MTRCASLKGLSVCHRECKGGGGGCLQKSRDQSGGRASSRQDTMLCSLGVEATEMGKVDGFQGI